MFRSFSLRRRPKNDKDEHSSSEGVSWKFWRRFSTRRGKDRRGSKKDFKRNDSNQPNVTHETTTETVEVPADSLPDVVDKTGGLRRSQSCKPAPPKPPRLFLFRSSSITNKKPIVNNPLQSSTEMSESLSGSKTISDGTDSNRDRIRVGTIPEETVVAEEPDKHITISLSNMHPKVGRIKIVTPDLSSRKLLTRPRKKSGDISESDRHRKY
ncbi:hypothetical protein ScPMuIL_009331 [Solemya velum]